MEEYKKNKPYFVVGLRVFSKNAGLDDIDDMGRRLKIEPKTRRRIGDTIRGGDGQAVGKRVDNLSLFDDVGGYVEGEWLDERLTRVVDQLGQIEDLISIINEEGGKVEIIVGWFISNHTSTGATFNSSLFKKIGALDVDLQLFAYGDDEAQSSSSGNEK